MRRGAPPPTYNYVIAVVDAIDSHVLLRRFFFFQFPTQSVECTTDTHTTADIFEMFCPRK